MRSEADGASARESKEQDEMSKNTMVWVAGKGGVWLIDSEGVSDRMQAAFHDSDRGVLGL
jgi:hypothetical protein